MPGYGANPVSGGNSVSHEPHVEDRGHSGLEGLREVAEENRRLIESLDVHMEALTRRVCPTCRDVCCISRHGRPAADDLVYYKALNLVPPPSEPDRPDTSPCHQLGASGCRLPRAERPYRCTWYFCTPLIEALDRLPARQARVLDAQLSRLSSARIRLVETHAAIEADPLHPDPYGR